MHKSEIRQDFRSTWFICLILIVGMLPLWMGGYCMYVMIALLPICLLYYRKIDGTCLLVIIFSVLYTFFKYINGHIYTPSSLIFDLIFPFIMYQAGAYLVKRQRSPKSAILLLCLMAIALALPAILDNIKDAITTGQLINVSREILSDTGEVTRSATGYGIMLAIMDGCLGIALLKPSNRFDFRLKIMIAIISVLALFATIHLLNRTGLVIAAISIICVVFLPPYSFKKSVYTFVSLIIVLGAAIYFLGDSVFLLDAVNEYEARNSGGGSVSSYGGRSELWSAAINQLFTEPFGNCKGVYINGRYRYAHNLWLDTGAYAGIFPLLALIWITVIYFRSIIRMYRLRYFNRFEKNTLVLIAVALFLQMNTEPIMQGVPQFFWYFIFFISIISTLNNKYRKS